MLTVFPVPAFTDNYLWVIHDKSNAIVVDPGDATPVIDYLAAHSLTLNAILITHHHGDHIGGIAGLLAWSDKDIPVYAPADTKNSNIKARTHLADPSKNVSITPLGLDFQVLSLPGHTLDHIAYYDANHGWCFCGDVLFAGGCGRLREGTPTQAQQSLAQLRALPPTTKIFCAHEYTLDNLRFAIEVEPNNKALQERIVTETKKRAEHKPTLPTTIGLEIATNPFLRWDSEEVRVQAGRASSSTIDSKTPPDMVFAAIRGWKDQF
jgi:hydroxyacylglutathione hydrolase